MNLPIKRYWQTIHTVFNQLLNPTITTLIVSFKSRILSGILVALCVYPWHAYFLPSDAASLLVLMISSVLDKITYPVLLNIKNKKVFTVLRFTLPAIVFHSSLRLFLYLFEAQKYPEEIMLLSVAVSICASITRHILAKYVAAKYTKLYPVWVEFLLGSSSHCISFIVIFSFSLLDGVSRDAKLFFFPRIITQGIDSMVSYGTSIAFSLGPSQKQTQKLVDVETIHITNK